MSVIDTINEITVSINSSFTVGNDTFFESKNDMNSKAIVNALGIYQYNKQIEFNNFKRLLTRPGNQVAPIIGLKKKEATSSQGFVSFQGTVGSVLPSGSQMQSPSGNLYTTLTSSSVNSITIPITSVTSNGLGLITVTTAINHNLASGLIVNIAGVTDPLYNTLNASITVTDLNKFTFIKTIVFGSSTGGNVTGTLLSVEVRSQSLGDILNVDRGVKMSLLNTVSGINTAGYVQYTKILGGADEETDADFDLRVTQVARSQPAYFNVDTIKNFVIQIAGVTRVFVKYPSHPYCIVRFMRDADINPFPDSQASLEVKNAIINGYGTEKPIWPVGDDINFLSVSAPINNPCNISFTYIISGGYSASLKDKINLRLNALFKDINIALYEIKIPENYIKNAILQGLNDDNTLSLEVRDNVINGAIITYTNVSFVDSLATLGTVTYP